MVGVVEPGSAGGVDAGPGCWDVERGDWEGVGLEGAGFRRAGPERLGFGSPDPVASGSRADDVRPSADAGRVRDRDGPESRAAPGPRSRVERCTEGALGRREENAAAPDPPWSGT